MIVIRAIIVINLRLITIKKNDRHYLSRFKKTRLLSGQKIRSVQNAKGSYITTNRRVYTRFRCIVSTYIVIYIHIM